MLFIVPFVVATAAITSVTFDLPSTAKVIFPSQDDQNEYTGSANGCDIPPPLLEPLERHISKVAPKNYVRYDIAALNRKHMMGAYYVYSRQACQKLRHYFPSANVFVMARITLRRCEFLPNGTTRAFYDVEAKVYSLASGREEVIFRQQDVAREQIRNLLVGKEAQLLERVESVIGRARTDRTPLVRWSDLA